jgi:predicted transposase YbfD/YdcC
MLFGDNRRDGYAEEDGGKIIDKKGGYVLSLKGNQGTLYQDVTDYFQACSSKELEKTPFTYHSTFAKDHGEMETRKNWE